MTHGGLLASSSAKNSRRITIRTKPGRRDTVKGFSLVELLVVIGIIGLLMSIVIRTSPLSEHVTVGVLSEPTETGRGKMQFRAAIRSSESYSAEEIKDILKNETYYPPKYTFVGSKSDLDNEDLRPGRRACVKVPKATFIPFLLSYANEAREPLFSVKAVCRHGE